MDSSAVLTRLLLIALIAFPSIARPQVSEDRLRIEGIVGGDNVVVMLNARARSAAGACTDSIVRSTGDVALGKGCDWEVAIFSAHNAMALESVSTGTGTAGSVHKVTLQPIIKVPVTVWVVDRAAWARAHDEMNNANLLYKRNKVGVQFVPTYRDISGANFAPVNQGMGIGANGRRECKVALVKGSSFHTHKTLNVYYVNSDDAGDVTGRNCAITQTPPEGECPPKRAEKGDGNITYIGSSDVDLAVLAHELGHALGLRPGTCGGHTIDAEDKPLPGFRLNNIMAGLSSLRDHFSLGQIYRMNTQSDEWGGTMLIGNGLRSGPERQCPPLAPPSTTCPALHTDWPGRPPLDIPSLTLEQRRKLLAARYEELEEQARNDPRFEMKSTKAQFIKRYELP